MSAESRSPRVQRRRRQQRPASDAGGAGAQARRGIGPCSHEQGWQRRRSSFAGPE
ncbi:Hypothetical predicted protein, partial [Podarcis lilfordi]